MYFLTILIFVLTIIAHVPSSVFCESIVFYYAVSTYSHRLAAWPLAEALAEQGHNVTFISPYIPKNSYSGKVKDFVPTKLKEAADAWGDTEDVFADRKAGNGISAWSTIPDVGKFACKVILMDDDFLAWVKEVTVDLVIVDTCNECAYGLVSLWKSKLIVFSPSTTLSWFIDSHGLPDETSWIPDMMLSYPADMTFFQRLKNSLLPVVWHIYRRWRYLPSLEQLYRDKLKLPDSVNFEEIEKNTSMVFINTHYGEEFPRSLPPNIISLGGVVLTEKRAALPKELDEFLERGSAFIYVSFGTYAKFTRMDRATQNAIIGALRSFPKIQFVWKVENDTLFEEFPHRNVYISWWMPQQDILSHPKIRAFITHSGIMGIQEAVYNAVPLLSFPIFADQDYNAERIHRRENGIRLEITTITQPQIEDAINRILADSKYANNMKKVSTMFKDRPQKPLETALWWTNFVLRHSIEELESLRPLSVGQPWWKKRQLDVWAFVIIVAGIAVATSVVLTYSMFKCLIFARFDPKAKKLLKNKLQ